MNSSQLQVTGGTGPTNNQASTTLQPAATSTLQAQSTSGLAAPGSQDLQSPASSQQVSGFLAGQVEGAPSSPAAASGVDPNIIATLILVVIAAALVTLAWRLRRPAGQVKP